MVTKYWALDYINPYDETVELVFGEQLYATQEEAQAARELLPEREFLEPNWYTFADLQDDIFSSPITITSEMKIERLD